MPSTRYIEILADQSPISYGSDENKRALYSLNFRARVGAEAVEIAEDMIKILQDKGEVMTPRTISFIGANAILPTGDGPYVQIIVSGGIGPDRWHDGGVIARPSIQMVVRAKDLTVARAKAHSIWSNLDGTRDVTVVR